MAERDPLRVVAGAWLREGRLLAARRAPGAARGDHWELPGGKVEPGESDAEALVRELQEELGCAVVVHQRVGEVVHHYPDVSIRLVAYRCSGDEDPQALEHAELAWLPPEVWAAQDWAPADVALVAALSGHTPPTRPAPPDTPP